MEPTPGSPAPQSSAPRPSATSAAEEGQPSTQPLRRPRGRRAAFPLDQLDSPAAASTSATAAGATAPGATAAEAAASSSDAPTDDASARAGRRRAASTGPSPAEQDVWSAADDGPEQDVWSDSLAPRTGTEPATPGDDAPRAAAPGTGAAATTPAPATEATIHRSSPEQSASTPAAQRGPTIVPGRTTPVSGASAPSAEAPAPASAAPSPERSAPSAAASARSAGSPSPAGSAASPADAPGGPDTGSLPKVAGWTVLTSVLPGSGLVTTRMRRVGLVMLTLLVLTVVAGGAFLLFGDPLRTGAMLVSRRGVLIGAAITTGVVGAVWALQIVLANLAQSTKERLEGAKRYLALALAAVMVVAVAVPFGRGVQSLWALQGLVGSESVFGGRDGDHPFTTGKDPWANTERLNILLLGQDSGEDRTGTRPDTIMVASIHPATGQTALFSIPRNLEHVEFPEGTPAAEEFPDGFRYFGQNQDLINAVWTWAEDRPDLFPNDPEPGLTATTWAVEETLGLETDYYAMVNLKGFEDMVDAIGGVDLVVERRIPIGGGASEVEGYIEPGEQKLDGFHALWYARSREGSNDFNRMCRQQRIVRAVTEEADPTTLALSVPGLVTATEENIQTDIPVSNLDAFVDLALRVKDGGFTSYPITQDVTNTADPDWEYLEQWVDASIEDSMKKDPPESVLGETEPGSSEPAETGAPPEEETGTGEGTDSEEETPTQEETSEETPTEEESSATDGAGEESKAPEVEQDPLKSCLPGSAQEG